MQHELHLNPLPVADITEHICYRVFLASPIPFLCESRIADEGVVERVFVDVASARHVAKRISPDAVRRIGKDKIEVSRGELGE
jgi:hypothetical protein